MRDLLEEVERAIRRRGWSARQASMIAVGTPELIRDMRRGRVPSVERFRALCEVLGLEFYVGRPRSEVLLAPKRLEMAIEIAEVLADSSIPRMTPAERARLAIRTYARIAEESEDEGKAGRRSFDRLVIERSTESPKSSESPEYLEPDAVPRMPYPRIDSLRRRP